jgi:hypothetical protein
VVDRVLWAVLRDLEKSSRYVSAGASGDWMFLSPKDAQHCPLQVCQPAGSLGNLLKVNLQEAMANYHSRSIYLCNLFNYFKKINACI